MLNDEGDFSFVHHFGKHIRITLHAVKSTRIPNALPHESQGRKFVLSYVIALQNAKL